MITYCWLTVSLNINRFSSINVPTSMVLSITILLCCVASIAAACSTPSETTNLKRVCVEMCMFENGGEKKNKRNKQRER